MHENSSSPLQSAPLDDRWSEDLFRQTFEHAHIGMALVGTDYRFLRVNAAFCRMLGYSEDELRKMSFVEVTHPEDIDSDCDQANGLFEGDIERYEMDKRYVARDGRIFWVHLTGSVVRDNAGKALHALAILEDIDARKRAEERLAQSEERLRLAMEGAQIATFEWDIRAGRILWSQNLISLVGVDPASFSDSYAFFESLVHPEDRERVQAALAAAMESGSYECDFRMIRHDGSVRWTAARGTVQFDPDRRPLRMLGVDIEITERRRMEEALRASEAFNRRLLGQLPGITYIFDVVQRRPIWINRAPRQGLGTGSESAVAAAEFRIEDRLHPEDWPGLLDHLQRLRTAADSDTLEWEYRLCNRDGSWRWMLSRDTPFQRGPDGLVTQILGTAKDITGHKEAEASLRQSYDLFHQIAECLPQMVWVSDAQGLRQYANQRWYDFTGEGRDRNRGENWLSAVHPEDRDRASAARWQSLATGEGFQSEHRLRRHDGEYRWMLAMAVPFHDPEGRIVRWFGTCTDITDQRLAEDSLRRAEKLAAVGRLAAAISHEINNPLASVANLVYLIRSNCSEPEIRRYAAVADEELRRATQIVTHSLRFHKQASRPTPERVSELIESILAVYRGRLRSGGIQVLREYRDTELVSCFADDIRQLFASLIGNALDAVSRGGVIRVRTRVVRHPRTGRSGVRVTVADSGQGMDAQTRRRIFEPFFTTKADQGTGLGLWVATGILEKHQGSVRVRSRRGQGTVFCVFLPCSSR